MYLRRFIRGAINAVNNNIQIQWAASTGYTFDPTQAGGLVPTYAVKTIWAQIQPVDTTKLANLEQLNIQGVLRSVYMRDAVASVVRPDGTGGDLLQFPETVGGPMRTWLVVSVPEQWTDYCHVIAQLQNDMNNAPWTADSSTSSDSPEAA